MPWNFDNSIPIYLQIIQEIKRRMIREELKPGDKLQSVRDLAKEAGVNPNTMQKALAELETEGLLESERTTGRFVTNNKALIKNLRDIYLAQQLHPFLNEIYSLGINKDELIALIEDYYKEAKK